MKKRLWMMTLLFLALGIATVPGRVGASSKSPKQNSGALELKVWEGNLTRLLDGMKRLTGVYGVYGVYGVSGAAGRRAVDSDDLKFFGDLFEQLKIKNLENQVSYGILRTRLVNHSTSLIKTILEGIGQKAGANADQIERIEKLIGKLENEISLVTTGFPKAKVDGMRDNELRKKEEEKKRKEEKEGKLEEEKKEKEEDQRMHDKIRMEEYNKINKKRAEVFKKKGVTLREDDGGLFLEASFLEARTNLVSLAEEENDLTGWLLQLQKKREEREKEKKKAEKLKEEGKKKLRDEKREEEEEKKKMEEEEYKKKMIIKRLIEIKSKQDMWNQQVLLLNSLEEEEKKLDEEHKSNTESQYAKYLKKKEERKKEEERKKKEEEEEKKKKNLNLLSSPKQQVSSVPFLISCRMSSSFRQDGSYLTTKINKRMMTSISIPEGSTSASGHSSRSHVPLSFTGNGKPTKNDPYGSGYGHDSNSGKELSGKDADGGGHSGGLPTKLKRAMAANRFYWRTIVVTTLSVFLSNRYAKQLVNFYHDDDYVKSQSKDRSEDQDILD
ncbi:MAG: hypothetical protein LBU15_01770 [Rickettsiales bacterium]|nr:hypothetical protein [Rickettsiales bacterium]